MQEPVLAITPVVRGEWSVVSEAASGFRGCMGWPIVLLFFFPKAECPAFYLSSSPIHPVFLPPLIDTAYIRKAYGTDTEQIRKEPPLAIRKVGSKVGYE
jgi:hypothetical protein